MKGWQIGLLTIVFIGVIIGGSYAAGWIGVHQTKTIKKAQQNADREVFEQTNSFTKAKRQEAIKLYKEYNNATTDKQRGAIAFTVSQSFADFDEEKYITNIKLRNWINKVKLE